MTEPLTDADNDLLDAIFNEGFDEKYSGCKEQHYFCSAVEGALRVAIMKRIGDARAEGEAKMRAEFIADKIRRGLDALGDENAEIAATLTIDFATADEADAAFAWLEQNMPSPQTGTLSMRTGAPAAPLGQREMPLSAPSAQRVQDNTYVREPSEAEVEAAQAIIRVAPMPHHKDTVHAALLAAAKVRAR